MNHGGGAWAGGLGVYFNLKRDGFICSFIPAKISLEYLMIVLILFHLIFMIPK